MVGSGEAVVNGEAGAHLEGIGERVRRIYAASGEIQKLFSECREILRENSLPVGEEWLQASDEVQLAAWRLKSLAGDNLTASYLLLSYRLHQPFREAGLLEPDVYQ